jgi:hypothetical protein
VTVDEPGSVNMLSILATLLDSDANANRRASWTKDGTRWAGVIALAIHVERLAWAYRVLASQDLAFEGAAVARGCYEGGLRAQWLAEVPDGPLAMLNERTRRARAMLNNLTQAKWVTDADDIDRLKGNIGEETPTESSAKHVERMCADLTEVADNGYLVYRTLSLVSHPAADVIELYLKSGDDGVWNGFNPRADGEILPSEGWTYAATCGLIWALQAADRVDPHHERLPNILAAARSLKIPATLTLSPKAALRVGLDGMNAAPIGDAHNRS